jgi:hypothetical protein
MGHMGYGGGHPGPFSKAPGGNDAAEAPRTFGYEAGDDVSGGSAGGRGNRGLRHQATAHGADEAASARPRRLDFSDLDLPECLLIKPIRLWLHGPENWPLIGLQYRAQFGEIRATGAMVALRGVIEILNAGGRRMMHFQKAWKRTTTGDERALVALAAAVQAGDMGRAQAMALRLVGPDWQQPLLTDLAALTEAFTAKGHRFVHLPPRGMGAGTAAGPLRLSRETPPRQAPASRP